MTNEIKKENIIALIKCFNQKYFYDMSYDLKFEYKYVNLFIEISYFFYLLTNENILNEICSNQLNFGYQDMKYMTILIHNYWNYNTLWKNSTERQIVTPILIPLQNKIKSMYMEYDDIINKLDKLKILKTKFIISKYNECLKYSEYVEEECLGQEKLLLSLSKINKYNTDIDKLVTNIIMLPIQKHTFCISTCIDIIIPIHEIYEHQILVNINTNNMVVQLPFRKLFDTLQFTVKYCCVAICHDTYNDDGFITVLNKF